MLLLYFLRLVRLGNLLVMAVTMCIVQAFIAFHGNAAFSKEAFLDNYIGVSPPELSFAQNYLLPYNFTGQFFLLILSVVFIAAAGNIINDYFDVQADKVNKPHKMVVDKHIQKNHALVLSWILNILGLAIATYLSWVLSNYWIASIALGTIVFLWFYSAVYKRKIFVGNIIIAVLVGIVPLYVLIFNLPLRGFETMVYGLMIDFGTFFVIKVIVIVSTIAFMINLMREIIKDIADIRGDLYLEAKTVPIALGIRRTKTILILMLIPLLCLMAFYVFDVNHLGASFIGSNQSGFDTTKPAEIFENLNSFNYFVVGSGIFCLVSFVILLSSNQRKKYLLASNFLKLAMLFGMISPLFL